MHCFLDVAGSPALGAVPEKLDSVPHTRDTAAEWFLHDEELHCAGWLARNLAAGQRALEHIQDDAAAADASRSSFRSHVDASLDSAGHPVRVGRPRMGFVAALAAGRHRLDCRYPDHDS